MQKPKAIKESDKTSQMRIQRGDAGRARWYHRAFQLLLRGTFHLFFRIRVKGLNNVPRDPSIICVNHLGWTDPFLVLVFFPLEPRIYILGEQEVKQIQSSESTRSETPG